MAKCCVFIPHFLNSGLYKRRRVLFRKIALFICNRGHRRAKPFTLDWAVGLQIPKILAILIKEYILCAIISIEGG
jgi:hypothetical protein